MAATAGTAALGENRILILSETPVTSSAELTAAAEDKIAGQRGYKVDTKIDTIDSSNKDTGGRKTYIPGRIETKISVDGMKVYGDANLKLLETKLENKQTVYAVEMDVVDNTARCAKVLITSLTEDAKDGSEITYAADLVLCEDWVAVTGA